MTNSKTITVTVTNADDARQIMRLSGVETLKYAGGRDCSEARGVGSLGNTIIAVWWHEQPLSWGYRDRDIAPPI